MFLEMLTIFLKKFFVDENENLKTLVVDNQRIKDLETQLKKAK